MKAIGGRKDDGSIIVDHGPDHARQGKADT